MTGIGENTLAQPVKPPLRERCACLAKLVKNRLTLTAAAVVDRLVYTGRLVEFNGASYRMENALMLGKGEAE